MCAATAAWFARVAEDVPFFSIYLPSTEPGLLRLGASTGLDASPALRPAVVDASSPAGWPLTPPAPDARAWTVALTASADVAPVGPRGEPVEAARVVRLDTKGSGAEGSVVVCGLAPRHELDPTYDTFLHLALTHVEAALLRASATPDAGAAGQAERARALLEAVVEQMPAGVILAEAPSGRTLLSSQRVRSLRGVEVHTESAEHFARYPASYPDGTPIDPPAFPIVRALHGETVSEVEVVVEHPTSGRKTLLVSAGPVRDAEGRVVASVSTFVDITERKRTELALRESEERGRAIVAALEEGIVLRDADGAVRFANASAERLLGMSTAEIARRSLGDPDWTILREDGTPFPTEALSTSRVFRDGAPVSSEVLGVYRPDGSLVWLSLNAQPILDAQGRVSGVVSSFYDITERREVDRERRALLARAEAARQAAESASRAKDEFLAVVSHELRNPLNAMLGWTRLLRAGALSDERAARALETIERNATSQAVLIEDLLDVSRVISGKLQLDVQEVALARVVEAAVDSARPAIDAKGIALQLAIDAEGTVSGDADRLQQVVWNLLTNATKFTPPGGTLDVRLSREGGHLELSVADSGQGIEADFLPHAFDRFRQADASTTRHHGGLGLGLAIAKSLVELHGGTIEARSGGVGAGATFVVRIPVASTASPHARPMAPRSTGAKAPSTRPGALHALRVLVVDDEPDARELTASILASHGAAVSTAASTEAAWALITRDPPDVLLSDIGMPGEDGYALIERIRRLTRDRGGWMPAACLSGYTSRDDRRRASQAGFHMHLAKPVEPSELIAAVRDLGRMASELRGEG